MSESKAGGPRTRRKGQGDSDKRSIQLRKVVEHPVRLQILGRLDCHPHTLSRLSVKIDKGEPHAAYHVQMLESAGLVKKTGDTAGRHALHVARLKDHPCWVARAVNEHTLPSGD